MLKIFSWLSSFDYAIVVSGSSGIYSSSSSSSPDLLSTKLALFAGFKRFVPGNTPEAAGLSNKCVDF